MSNKLSLWEAEFIGLFIGEGYIGITKNGNQRKISDNYTARVQITMRDDDFPILQDIQRRLGGMVYHEGKGRMLVGADGKTRKINPFSVWRCRNTSEVAKVVAILKKGSIPSRKLDQYSVMEEFLDTFGKLGNGRGLGAAYNKMRADLNLKRAELWKKLIELHAYSGRRTLE